MRARRPFVGLLAASLVLPVAATLAGAAPAAAAEPVVEVGWWTRSPSQAAPEGGFAVAAGPDGASTVAAIRVTLPGLSSASLTAVEDGGLNQGAAAVQACPTADPWTPTAGGDLAEAPEADCEAGSVALTRDAESTSWTGDLTPLVRNGALSVVLVPGEASGAAMLGFDVRFAAPEITATSDDTGDDAGSLGGESTGGGTTSDGTTSGSSGSGSSDSGTDGSGGSTSSSGADAAPSPVAIAPSTGSSFGTTASSGFGSSPSSSAGASFTASPPPVAPVATGSAPQPLVEGSAEEVALAPTAAGEQTAATFTPLSGGGEPVEPRWGQALFFVILSAFAGVAVAGGSRLRRRRGAATA